MFIFPDLSDELHAMQDAGIVISPWLAGLSSEGRLDAALYSDMSTRAREFAHVHWTEEERVRVLHHLPSPDRIPQIAVHEIVASTAVYLAHERTGQLEVDHSLAEEAMNRVNQFVTKHGFGTLLQLYMLVTSWENQNALDYFGEIPEREFVLGSCHRPWVDYSLGEELMFAALLGNAEVVERDGHRFVRLTEEGKQALERASELLEQAGYFKQRLQFLRISQFNLYDAYEQVADEIWPDTPQQRKDFVQFVGVQPGMRVLELGCANGSLTFEGGLADAVQPGGHIIAVDPSSGMLARARTKQRSLQIDWIEFMNGRAESLPFDAGSFDLVLGTGFLHFTDLKLSIPEMTRLVRPGGVIGSWHPLKADLNVPFFREWFAPLFELAAKRAERPRDFLIEPNTVNQSFATAGLVQVKERSMPFTSLFHDPAKVVNHFIRGVGWFSEELAPLPWKARENLIEDLIERGRFVCNRYSPDERVLRSPGQAIRAIRPRQ